MSRLTKILLIAASLTVLAVSAIALAPLSTIGLQVDTQASTPFAAGKAGFWQTADVPKFRKSDNTDITLSGGSGTVTSVSAGTGITATPNPIVATGSIAIANTAVTPGSYNLAGITVDAQGRLTAASNGTAYSVIQSDGSPQTQRSTLNLTGGVTCADDGPTRTNCAVHYQTLQINGSDQTQRAKLNFTTNFTNTDTTVSTVDLASTAVTAGSYFGTNLTVDAKGRITAAANGSFQDIYDNGAAAEITTSDAQGSLNVTDGFSVGGIHFVSNVYNSTPSVLHSITACNATAPCSGHIIRSDGPASVGHAVLNVGALTSLKDSSAVFMLLNDAGTYFASWSFTTAAGWVQASSSTFPMTLSAGGGTGTFMNLGTGTTVSFGGSGVTKAVLDWSLTPALIGYTQTMAVASLLADSGSAVAVSLGSAVTYSTAGSKLVSFTNLTTEKASVAFDGVFTIPGLINTGKLSCKFNTQSGTTYTILGTDCLVNATNAAARTITLIAASSFSAGQQLTIKDGAATGLTANVTINRAGGDTIVNTATGQTSTTIATNGGSTTLVSDGSSTWYVIDKNL